MIVVVINLYILAKILLIGEIKYRLVNGNSIYSGRVEVFNYERWGTICNYSLDVTDATVLCRSMGYRFVVFVFGEQTFIACELSI